MKKKFLSFILSVLTVISITIPASAAKADPPVSTHNQGTYYNVRENVFTYYEWGPYYRVSSNLTGTSEGGSIICTQSLDFGVEVSGDLQGLSYSASTSVSTSIGYSINVPPNKTMYMAFRVRYEVESGMNARYNTITGQLVSRKPYTIKTPLYGDYILKDA